MGLDVSSANIPDSTTQVKYILNTNNGEVTIIEIALGTNKASVAIPDTICGYDVIVVVEGCQNLVGKHTCKGGTPTCTEKATCSLCGKGYGELANHSYGAVTYTWSEDGKTCTAKNTCSVCLVMVSEEATVENKKITSAVKIPATCKAKGTTTSVSYTHIRAHET